MICFDSRLVLFHFEAPPAAPPAPGVETKLVKHWSKQLNWSNTGQINDVDARPGAVPQRLARLAWEPNWSNTGQNDSTGQTLVKSMTSMRVPALYRSASRA